MSRIVVVGDLMTDTVARAASALVKGSVSPAAVTVHGGGSGANVAAWLAADGAEAALVGRRGSDTAGRTRDMELKAYGVDARLAVDPEQPTGTCVVIVTHKGDRTMLCDLGANACLSPQDLPNDLFTQGSHLHVSGYTLLNEGSRSAAVAAMERAGQAEMTISVDGGSVAPLEHVGPGRFLDLADGATLLLLNGAQATVFTGSEDPAQAIQALNAWCSEVVVKPGPDDALYANGQDPVRVPAQPPEKFVDGTGAGGAFRAGFLHSWLDKKPPAEALAHGHWLAARALGRVGARPAPGVPRGGRQLWTWT